MPTPLSCYVLTYNSERRLDQVLQALRPIADDLLVVDSGSTDATLDIARHAGARILYRPFDNFRDQRMFAESECRHLWVFEIDSDEVVSPELAARIEELKRNDFDAGDPHAHFAYAVTREWFVLGRRVHVFYPIRTPDQVLRLYRRDRVHHGRSRIIHECPGWQDMPRGIIEERLLHYTCDTVDQLYAKLNLYTRLHAEDMYAKGERATFAGLYLYPWYIWARCYLWQGGWKDGEVGRLHARYVRDSGYLRYAKLKHDFREAAQPGTPSQTVAPPASASGPPQEASDSEAERVA